MQALAGRRVVDFGHVWAGPFCGQILADLGAEVIRVESHGHLDVHRRAGPYPESGRDIDASAVWIAQNRGKLSCAINLKEPRGVELALQLAGQADVVIENFRPGTLDRLGLGYDQLREANPRVVLVSLSGYGQDGPWHLYPAYGPMMDAVGGLSFAARTPELEPQSVNGWFPDTSAALFGALAALLGLRKAEATGSPSHFDISEMETTIALVPELIALAAANRDGAGLERVHSNAVPSGEFVCVVPAEGEDEWVALHVATDEQWRALAELTGAELPPHLIAGLSAPDDATAALAVVTRTRPRDLLCEALQARGVSAVPVLSARDLLSDPHLEARGAFIDANHPRARRFRSYAPVIRGAQPTGNPDRAPLLGEHNRYVFEELLGLPEAERLELEREGVLR